MIKLKRIYEQVEKKEAIAVDASCVGNPGPVEYQGVFISDGEIAFKQGPYQGGTNNIGEFLAIVHALAYCKKEGYTTMPIYSDSQTALTWVKKRQTTTTMQPNEKNAQLFNLIERAERWLQTNSYSNPVLKWMTREWGEIPSDYGRKE